MSKLSYKDKINLCNDKKNDMETGNISGIYDMSGGANEYMASYSNRILGDAIVEMGPFYYYKNGDNSTRYHNN